MRADDFWFRIAFTDECWFWTGAINDSGYGVLRDEEGRFWKAHRYSYTLEVGPIPEGDEIEHRCHTRALWCLGGIGCVHRLCIRPDHLVPMTHAENMEQIHLKHVARIRERRSV